jgi:hypothetical protein
MLVLGLRKCWSGDNHHQQDQERPQDEPLVRREAAQEKPSPDAAVAAHHTDDV